MSISPYQCPSIFTNRYVHQSIYPEYYTAISSLYTYNDFKFVYRLYTTDGLISTTKNPPYVEEGLGVYNPNPYIKNLFGIDFGPDRNNGFTTCPNSIINYRVEVEEQSQSISSPSQYKYRKATAIRCAKEGFDFNDYRMYNGEGKFLTNWTTRREIGMTGEYGTLRFLNGIQRSGYAASESRIYEIKLQVYRASYNYRYMYNFTSEANNPYYVETSQVGPSTDIHELEDLQKYLLEHYVGPETINNNKWRLRGVLDTQTGIYEPQNIVYSSSIIEENDHYDFYTYAWPYGVDGKTSSAMKFKAVRRCDKHKNVQLQWENELGGFDFFMFNKVSREEMSIGKSDFRKKRDKKGTYNNSDSSLWRYYMGHDEFDRGLSTFHTDIETDWVVNTDWLTDEQVDDMRDLWVSKNIFAYIDGEWYPVVSNIENVLVETSQKGLRQYTFSFRLSNKKYN